MKKDTIEQLMQEEEKLEAMISGTPTPDVTTEGEATETPVGAEEAPVKEEVLVAPTPQPATDEQPETKREVETDWEKRYKNLRNSRDTKLQDAKRQLGASLETISALQSQNQELRNAVPTVDSSQGNFTPEQREALGDVTLEAMAKITDDSIKAATAPLQEQLDAERKRRDEQLVVDAESAKTEAYDLFIGRVERAVPEWRAINFDPAFETYMAQADLDGTTKSEHFQRAEARGDAQVIIRYMMDFQGSKQVVVPKVDKLAEKVTPVGDGVGATQAQTDKSQGEQISKAYIDKFYDDLSRGRYAGRHAESKAIEDRIDAAAQRGLIVT